MLAREAENWTRKLRTLGQWVALDRRCSQSLPPWCRTVGELCFRITPC